jgi:hypothetical protein
MFNNALAAVERTGDGQTVLVVMQNIHGYMNVYYFRPVEKRSWAKAGGPKQAGGTPGTRLRPIEGFPTTTKTRPVMLNRVGVLIRETPELLHDIDTVKECLTFVKNEKGKPEAVPGTHDDRVMALGIANFARLDLLGFIDPSLSESYDEERETIQ